MLKYAVILIISTSLIYSMPSLGESRNTVKVIEPKKKVSKAEAAQIDTEKFQVGLYTGLLAVEDFNTNLLVGISFQYQVAPSYIVQLNYASFDIELAEYEKNAGAVVSGDRNFSYVDVVGGYKLFSGRSFLGAKRKFDSDIYVLAGIGSVDIFGASEVGLTLGTSYRVVFTDWLVGSFDIKDHIFSRDLQQREDKLTHNIEMAFGFNALF